MLILWATLPETAQKASQGDAHFTAPPAVYKFLNHVIHSPKPYLPSLKPHDDNKKISYSSAY